MYIYSNACDDCKITLKTLSVPVMQLTNTVMFLIGRIGIVIAVILLWQVGSPAYFL